MPDHPEVLTRRRFLRTSVLGAALSWTVPLFIERTFSTLNAAAESASSLQVPTGKDHPILVVLQLAGGNDGLNTLIPYDDDAYYRARPTLAIPNGQALPLGDRIGLHPALAPLADLYHEGTLAVLQGVGYPNPNRSHFRSTEIWQTASDANRVLTKGWLGRYFDNCCSGEDPTVGVSLGQQLPQAFNAQQPVGMAIERPDHLGLPKVGDAGERAAFEQLNGLDHEHDAINAGDSIASLNGAVHSNLSPLEYLQRVALDAQVGADRIGAILKRTKAEASYPNTPLGRSLSSIARLIAGGLTTRVYYLSHGGFDTHSAQAGAHQRLLGELANATAAFCHDLRSKGLLDRVTLMTFSEFGRRVAENASKGTDHGTAAPLFVMGGAVRPGLYGRQPSLEQLDGGDLIFNVDFRSVYATILERWMQAPAQKVLGREFPLLAFL
ncbi:MAG: DUF1501 domain-containing protein [Verrucomicrobia bacterium]|nr:DUF1501 domain-containing protein [Verrucomicrobiota bacterium]